ncbi:MAG: alpha/beta fold hydrolase [Acidimicrobiales bacterium]
MAPVSLHTETLSPPGAGAPGGRVVLVHGFTQTARSWGTVAATLAGAGHEVVLPDAPGHGGSADIAADLATGARLLGEAGGGATYVGYSMGARLCLHLALAQPELVERLVMLGATAGIEDPAARAARRRADETLADSLDPPPGSEGDPVGEPAARLDAFLDEWLARPLFATLPPQAAGLDDRRRNTPAGLASSLRLAGTGTQESLWDRLHELAMPTLVMAGALDAAFAARAARMVAAIGPNATLALLPGAGHAAHLEQPGAFAGELFRFVGEGLGTTGQDSSVTE